MPLSHVIYFGSKNLLFFWKEYVVYPLTFLNSQDVLEYLYVIPFEMNNKILSPTSYLTKISFSVIYYFFPNHKATKYLSLK